MLVLQNNTYNKEWLKHKYIYINDIDTVYHPGHVSVKVLHFRTYVSAHVTFTCNTFQHNVCNQSLFNNKRCFISRKTVKTTGTILTESKPNLSQFKTYPYTFVK